MKTSHQTNASDLRVDTHFQESDKYRSDSIGTIPFEQCWDDLSNEGNNDNYDCGDCTTFSDIDLEEACQKKAPIGPNQPHPALEFIPCYHAMKHFPQWLERFRAPYACRWKLFYPLQRRCACSGMLLKMGVYLTWGEVLLLIPFFVVVGLSILYTCVYPTVAGTGKVARIALIAAFVLAQRNSLVTFALGMPVDRCLYYHKLAGRVGGITGLLHFWAFLVHPKFRKHHDDFLRGAFTGQVNASGSYMMIFIVAMVLTSLPWVRRKAFEVFYFLHNFFAICLVAGAFFHSGVLVPTLVFLTWGVDFSIRKLLMAWTLNPQRATLKIISNTVIEVSFPKTESFAYNPGQYVYLCIPEITWLQWHPFSISSAPYQDVVTLHIRKAGNWTGALLELASKKQEVDILLEGPYGSVAVDIMGDRKYKSVLLISGGIGITPMQSISAQLMHEKEMGQREMRNLKFIWIERDPVLVQEVSFFKDKQAEFNDKVDAIADGSLEFHGAEGIVSSLMSLLPPGETSDAELDELYADGGLPMADSSVAFRDDPAASRCSVCPPLESIVVGNDANESLSEKKILDIQVYLTGNSKPLGTVPFARFGRPDFKQLFEEMRSNAISSGDQKVAVCVSAPHKVMTLCHRACVLYSDENVRFDYHCEAMGI